MHAAQFAVGSALALVMWTLNLHSKPKVDKDLVRLPAPPHSLQGRESSLETVTWNRGLH